MADAPTLVSSVLVTAMAHPLRLAIFTLLLEREATANEIVEELEVPRRWVYYHLGVLKDIGCIELTHADASAGGRVVQYTYKAVDRAYFDEEGWARLSPENKLKVIRNLIRVISEDISDAVSEGTFFEPDDNHISRSPMRVDLEGWGEVRDFLDVSCLDELTAIQDRVNDRCQGTDRKTFPMKVEIIQLRSPDRKKDR